MMKNTKGSFFFDNAHIYFSTGEQVLSLLLHHGGAPKTFAPTQSKNYSLPTFTYISKNVALRYIGYL